MPNYTYDHIHLRTRDPEATTKYYHEMFGAKIVESVQSDGQSRVDIDLNGRTIFVPRGSPEADVPVPPATPHSAPTVDEPPRLLIGWHRRARGAGIDHDEVVAEGLVLGEANGSQAATEERRDS